MEEFSAIIINILGLFHLKESKIKAVHRNISLRTAFCLWVYAYNSIIGLIEIIKIRSEGT